MILEYLLLIAALRGTILGYLTRYLRKNSNNLVMILTVYLTFQRLPIVITTPVYK